jgi:hypothetical protein
LWRRSVYQQGRETGYQCNGRHGGQFAGKGERPALDAGSAKFDKSVYLGSMHLKRGMAAEGVVRFAYAEVTHDFEWWGLESPEKATLDLRFAEVGRLLNHQNSWPNKGNVFIDGFLYNEVDDRASPNADTQLGWLNLQPQEPFLSQP